MDKIILKNIHCTGKRSGSYGNRRRSPKCSYKVGCFGSDTPVRGRTSTLPNPYFYFRFYFLLYPKHTHTHTHTHTHAQGVLETSKSSSSKNWKTLLFVLKKQVDTERSTLDFYKDTKKRWQKQVCGKRGGKGGEGRGEEGR